MASSNITIRQAQRPDISRMAEVANAANVNSAIHHRMAPNSTKYPLSFHQWRLNILRQRFATPNLRTIVAEDASSGQLLGLASYMIEGEDTALYKRWVAESGWWNWAEGKLVGLEKLWCQYVTDKSVDYNAVDRFVAAFSAPGNQSKTRRPACLHCHLIVVDPDVQSRGVGKMLIDWAKELTVEEGLPLYLESNLEATRFYAKNDFARLRDDLVIDFGDGKESIRIPVFVWEGKEREGRWLERVEGPDGQWKWRAHVLPEQDGQL